MVIDFSKDYVNGSKVLFGFENFNTDYFNTDNYKKILIDLIINKHKHEDSFSLPYRTTSYIINEAQKQIVNAFGDIDRTIPIVQDNLNLLADFYALYGPVDNDSINSFFEHLKKNAKYDDIFKLPVHLHGGDMRNAQIKSLIFNIEGDINYSEFPNLYTGIDIISCWDDLSAVLLVHEMIHGLINRHRGIIKNGLLNEVLSIFMELVSSLNMDETKKLLGFGIKFRILTTKYMLLDSLKKEFTEDDTTILNGYLISTLLAFSLFNNYLKASDNAKKDILNEIKKTLIGERCLEDTLKVLDANELEGTEVVRFHINRLL